MPIFSVLPGLPTSGPMYVPFTATGQAKYSEGLVVEFQPSRGDRWVGNFAKGLTSFSKVLPHPNGTSVLVISGGQGYVIDPDSRALIKTIGGWFDAALEVLHRQLIILQGSVDVMALGSAGRVWETRRLSWDGMRSVRVSGDKLFGEARELDDSWTPFEVDLNSGKVTGGSRSQ